MINLRSTLFLLIFWAASPSFGKEKSQSFNSGPSQVALVEVFTSEGCSSCPPTDRWLSGLKKHPQLFQTFVPVGEHVDYWNFLGWDDRFSATDISSRQRSLARKWAEPSVYTPAVIVNGLEYRSRNTDFKTNTRLAGNLNVTWQGNIAKVSYEPPNKKLHYEVFGTYLEMDVNTKVKRGENAGRSLTHDFVACKLHKTKLTPDKRKVIGTLKLPPCKHKGNSPGAIAFWVTKVGQPQPIQAVGGYLQ